MKLEKEYLKNNYAVVTGLGLDVEDGAANAV